MVGPLLWCTLSRLLGGSKPLLRKLALWPSRDN